MLSMYRSPNSSQLPSTMQWKSIAFLVTTSTRDHPDLIYFLNKTIFALYKFERECIVIARKAWQDSMCVPNDASPKSLIVVSCACPFIYYT